MVFQPVSNQLLQVRRLYRPPAKNNYLNWVKHRRHQRDKDKDNICGMLRILCYRLRHISGVYCMLKLSLCRFKMGSSCCYFSDCISVLSLHVVLCLLTLLCPPSYTNASDPAPACPVWIWPGRTLQWHFHIVVHNPVPTHSETLLREEKGRERVEGQVRKWLTMACTRATAQGKGRNALRSESGKDLKPFWLIFPHPLDLKYHLLSQC